MKFIQKKNYTIEDLLEIMRILRSPEGCPWDKEQTHASIRKNMIEEAYEAAEAIDENDDEMLSEELGDVLLQVVFHSQMATEGGRFSFDDVCDGVCKKLILRHPHIFSDVVAKDSEQVLINWNQIKQESKGNKTTASVLDSIAKSLPSLMRGQKIVKAACEGGLMQPMERTDKPEEKVTELLWQAVKIAAANKIDAEEVFTGALDTFIASTSCQKQ